MPIYLFECKNCGFENEGQYPITTPRIIDCPECGEEDVFVKQIVRVNFHVKGASAANGYYTPPSNEEIGLPSERELKKRLDSEYWLENTKKGGMVTQEEKEVIDYVKKEERAQRNERQKKIDALSEKYKPEAAAIKAAFAKSKNKTKQERDESKKKRKERGDYGTKKSDIKIDE